MTRTIQACASFLLLAAPLHWAIAGTGSAVGGDPAYEYCLKKGGTDLTFLDGKRNEEGFCQFSDGGLIDDWTLYKMAPIHEKDRENHTRAVIAFLAAPSRDDASPPADTAQKNCESLGGSVSPWRMKYRPDVTYFSCDFPDKSSIEEWTLYYGSKRNDGDAPHFSVMGKIIRALAQ